MDKIFKKHSMLVIQSKNLVKRFQSSSGQLVNKSIGEASQNKGLGDWDPSFRPVYMDSQVCIFELLYFKIICNLNQLVTHKLSLFCSC